MVSNSLWRRDAANERPLPRQHLGAHEHREKICLHLCRRLEEDDEEGVIDQVAHAHGLVHEGLRAPLPRTRGQMARRAVVAERHKVLSQLPMAQEEADELRRRLRVHLGGRAGTILHGLESGLDDEDEVGQVVLSHKVGNVRGLGEEELGDFSRVAICQSEKGDTLR